MKLIFRDIGQTQRFKRGADPVSSAVLGGASLVGNIAGSIIGSDSSESNVSRQLNAQRVENQKNRDWQSAEAEKNRNFQLGTMNISMAHQTSEREAQQEYQSGQWQHQFQEELAHRFDVPLGVNPAVYFSSHGAASGSGGSVSAPSGSMPSAPSGAMPSGVAGLNAVGYQPLNLQVPQLMSSLGSLMSGLANAKKSGVETSFLEKSLQDRLRQAMASADMSQLGVALSELDKKFQESTLPDRVKKVAADYKAVLMDIDLTGEKLLTERQEQNLKRVTADLNESLRDYNKSAKNKLDIEIQMLPGLIQSQILSNRGSAAAGFGSAEQSHESAQSIKFERELNQENRSYLANEIRQRAAFAGQNAKLSKSRISVVNELTHKLELENDWYVANQILDRIEQVVGDVIDFKNIKVKEMPTEYSTSETTEKYNHNGQTMSGVQRDKKKIRRKLKK